ncbi:MAG: site-2 protease family protein [Halanaerobiales bacterium]|nr:site-2 protease family protein [Bacillota bacterium]HOA40309.1 site-2 protease family protein [Halanaerobiales bacterium]HPZ62323.1 site-2 protease family protein [Halanaerobiales bacterium]HQD03201.1 site-2 protease family protein [Halanaerobiales bacterium]
MNNIVYYILLLPIGLLSISFHEYMHGKVSNMLGDPTPAIMGRLTLNPLAHLDPVGALALILFRIGWARPVPVNPRYYENPRKGLMYVALAGPASNFFLALVFAALLRLSLMTNFFGFYYLTGGNSTIIYLISNMLYMGVSLNITLALFNLLPLPPLDGSKILMGILPARFSRYFYKLEGPLGLIIILVLFTFDIIGKIIYPLASFFLNILV